MRAEAIVNPGSIDEDYIHVVAAIIWQREDRRRFLIAQRPKGKHLEDYWEFPGGKLEGAESPRQALQREIAEEIGIDIVAASPCMQVYYRYPQRNILLDTWFVDTYTGSVEAREQQALAWIDCDEIEAYLFPPADEPILEFIKYSALAGNRRLP